MQPGPQAAETQLLRRRAGLGDLSALPDRFSLPR